MAPIGQTYAEGRERITDVLSALDDEGGRVPVPTCPEWTVHDVAAHLVGACADILAGNLEGVATNSWTAAQVDARQDASLAELLAEWADVGPQVEAFADSFPGRAGDQWITDQTTHEHDIRGALGRPGGRESVGLDVGLDFLVTVGLDNSLGARGLGPIEVRSGTRRWVVGSATPTGVDSTVLLAIDDGSSAVDQPAGEPPGEPVAGLEAPPFELFRALTGRRSRHQIAGLGWSADPAPYLDAFGYGPFTVSPVDVVE